MNPELLNHFQNEWIHRHSHFWKILSSMLIVNTIITSFPICCKHFDIELKQLSINLNVFPAIGIFFSFICLVLLLAESYKIAYVRTQINHQLRKECIAPSKNKLLSLKPIKILFLHINYFVSIFAFFAMILFSIYMIIVLNKQYI